MDTYRVDVKSILDNLGGTIEVSDALPLTELDVGDEHFAMREPVRFDVALTNGGTGIEGVVDGYYVEHGHTENIPEEQEVDELDAEGYVDLLPEIMEALVLEAPFAPLHDEECAGICPECGADLNTEPCGCASAPDSTNPFASLGTLLETEPGSHG